MIGVIADWRRRGLGHALLADIMRACADCRRSITLEIDEANGASTALFRSLGAVPVATGSEMTSARPDRAIREGALATVVAS
jgi:ribosomal protein S18 acetylase RimI-like enzyme